MKSVKSEKFNIVNSDYIKPCVWETWVEQRTGAALDQREALESYQLQRLQENYAYVRQNSSFYRKKYEESPPALDSWQDFENLPLISGVDIREQEMEMLCVSQSQISRVVTLDTSGTTGLPKRLFFTAEDQELTVDFFHYGMETLAGPKDRVMILLPGCREGGMADLLQRGVERIPARVWVHGLVEDVEGCFDEICQREITVLVGIPIQVQALAACCKRRGITSSVERILLSTDVLSDTVRRRIEEGLSCRVFNHFGMTELGYGGALECEVHQGMHIRENDLYMEVVDPKTGKILPDGRLGELVITTLTRKGMPLFRYRTGDMARILPGRCPCGSVLKRLDGADGRLDADFDWVKLDDFIFSDESVVDYEVYWEKNMDLLHVFTMKYEEKISYRGKRQVKPYENSIDAPWTDGKLLQAQLFYRTDGCEPV